MRRLTTPFLPLRSKWVWPKIEGRESFKGPMLHSANWDSSISLKGKKVAVIGSGSSFVLSCLLSTLHRSPG